MEFTLLWAALTGVVAVWITLRVLSRLRLSDPGSSGLFDTILGAAVTGLIVGRLAAMTIGGTNPLSHPGDILLVRGDVDTGFASRGALAYLAWSSRKAGLVALDTMAPAILAGLAGWHGGCLFRGTCLGTRSALPWAFSESGSHVTRHPTELYAALLFLLAAGAAAWLLRRLPGSGVPAAFTLLAAAAIRWVTEPLRASLGAGPVAWYATGTVFGIVGILVAGRHARRAGPDRE